MRPITKSLLATPLLLTLAALSIGQTPAPRVLAVININKVFASLNEKLDGDAEIKKMADGYQADQTKREQSLEKIADALQLKAEYDSYGNMAQQKLLIEQRLKTIQIYRRMNDAIKQYAEQKGIGL